MTFNLLKGLATFTLAWGCSQATVLFWLAGEKWSAAGMLTLFVGWLLLGRLMKMED